MSILILDSFVFIFGGIFVHRLHAWCIKGIVLSFDMLKSREC